MSKSLSFIDPFILYFSMLRYSMILLSILYFGWPVFPSNLHFCRSWALSLVVFSIVMRFAVLAGSCLRRRLRSRPTPPPTDADDGR